YGHFSGINRKVQLTYLPHGCPKTSSEEEDCRRDEPSLLLVLKWGGELTPAGRIQAEELGRAFRCMYPGGQGDYAGFPGCGLLRLHSTYRHDLKIYASDEGRVQMTAAAFAKGLLALEGELTPILVQMVKSANMNGLLDSDSDSLSSCQHRVKARLHEILQRDRDFSVEDYEKLTPTGSISQVKSMQIIKNPVKTCDIVYSLIQSLTTQIRQKMEDPKYADIQLYHSETLDLMLRRWCKLEKDFKTKNGRYDISKIPDIYDCIKYDVQHNCSLKLENTMELYRVSKALADIVIPQQKTTTEKNAAGDTTGYSMELFTHTVPGLESEAVNSPCPLQIESDMECSDAQPQPDYYAGPLTQTTTLPSQGADQESDPDETMLPHHERYTTERHGDTDEVAQEVQEELLDDPVLDPDWQPLGEQGAGGSSSEAEEEEGPQQASTSPQVPSAGPVSCPKRVAKPKPGGGQRGHPVKAQSAMPE
ncbi:unnamed protein product, partial [Ranitomeya imitator]